MEEVLKKVVNLGIGAVKSIEENLEAGFKKAEEGINDLISRGESASDDGSTKVKQFVDDLLNSVKEYESKAKELSENLVTALKEFDPLGSKKIDELNQKVDELASKIKG